MFKTKIQSLLPGDNRSVLATKNIFATGCLKVIDIFVYLLLIPVTLGYLNQYEYGIWLTVNSVLSWINSFDIGLGNGLRNRLTEALANNDYEKGKSLISTTLIIIALIMGGIIVVVSIIFPHLDCYNIFGTSSILVPNLNKVIFVSFIIFCVNFVLKVIGNVFLALQLPAVNYGISTGAHLLSLLIILFLKYTTDASLLNVAIVYSASPTLVYLIAFPITFLGKYRHLKPGIKYFQKCHVHNLMSVGVQFFVLQIASIILFAMTNLIISHYFGPERVTEYNIAYRYFYLVVNLTMLFLSPMWSATTDAYTKGDFVWINNTMRKINRILLLIGLGLIMMVLFSKFFYCIWVGDDVYVSFSLSSILAVYVYIIIWSQAYSFFLNGMGKLKIQMINTIFMAVVFYPLCLGLKQFGIIGIVSAMILVNLSGLIFNVIQFNKVISHKAIGMWNE